jgi:MFS family permease
MLESSVHGQKGIFVFGILSKRKIDVAQYPREFWFLFWGVFINRISASIIWPFLTVYMYQKLGVPLATVTQIMLLPAICGIFSTTIVSSAMDKVGRKWAMIIGLIGSACVFMGMAFANSLPIWIILIALHGTFIPIFNIGVNAMVADLIVPTKRSSAYALIRTVANAGIAIGPIVGGMLATISFELAFITTSFAYLGMIILSFFFLPETRPASEKPKRGLGLGDYRYVFRDKRFLAFLGIYFLMEMAYSHIFTLLPVYVSVNFSLPANQFSLIVTINAVMVVLFQFLVTKYTERFGDFTVMVAGSLLYAIGLLSVAFGSVLWHFMVSMAILTLGELVISPTSTTMVANIAPENMRARYLGLLSLGYSIGAGFGPVIGGFLNDTVAPVAMWYGAASMAIFAAIALFTLSRVWEKQKT